MAQAEKVALERALNVADQCVSLAATRLGISRATMHRKMRAHCLLRKKRSEKTRYLRDILLCSAVREF